MNPIAACYLERGIERFKRNEFDHAIAAFDVALRIDPDEPYARYNRATALLSIGDYEHGFREYETTWRLFHWRGFGPVGNDIDRIMHLPVWRGERDCRLLAYHELGYGDAIMAMRFLPEVKRRAETVLVIAQPLVRLARTFGIEATDRLPDDVSGFDYRLPFFGVMSALQQNETTIPCEPYIMVPVPLRNLQRNIGIAWSGRTQTAFSGDYFLSKLYTRDARLFALQPGEAPDGVEPFPVYCDFADLADRIACMDHIVSVDTAAIHLAGAMGHPSAHLLLPFVSDWRWWRTELWYPKVKIYRQENALDWTTPFAGINGALRSRSV